jgi:hypothetical protein
MQQQQDYDLKRNPGIWQPLKEKAGSDYWSYLYLELRFKFGIIVVQQKIKYCKYWGNLNIKYNVDRKQWRCEDKAWSQAISFLNLGWRE